MSSDSKEDIRIPANDSLERLDQDMAKKSLDGFWRVRLNVPPEPTTNVKPFLWKWEDCYESFVRAGKLVSPEDCDGAWSDWLTPASRIAAASLPIRSSWDCSPFIPASMRRLIATWW